MVLQSVGPLSAGKVLGTLYGSLGLIIGLIFSMVSVVGASGVEGFGSWAGLFGVGAIVALPIMYGCMGFISGVLSALFYNIFASLVGGIEVELS